MTHYATTTQNVYALSPANQIAGRVVSGQRNCNKSERLSQVELHELSMRLQAQRVPLKKELGIRKKGHHKSLMHNVSKQGTAWHSKQDVLIEYISLGTSLHRIDMELKRLKDDKKVGAA